MAEWKVQVCGTGTTPAPQGSMECKSRHMPGFHSNPQPSNKKQLHAWRRLVSMAGLELLRQELTTQLAGPLLVVGIHTIARPKSVPLRERAWPIVTGSKGHGDVDKFGRALLDGLAESGLFGNDAQVCGLHVWKRYPDSPAVPWISPRDHLPAPGVVIRITTIT